MRDLFCENCDKKLDFVYVDGYSFGDRLMEGILFKVKVVDNKPECIGVSEDDEPYMTQFNWEHWKKRCEEFCEDLDIATCPNCNYDVLVEDDETAASRPPPKPIGLKKAKDILGG